MLDCYLHGTTGGIDSTEAFCNTSCNVEHTKTQANNKHLQKLTKQRKQTKTKKKEGVGEGDVEQSMNQIVNNIPSKNKLSKTKTKMDRNYQLLFPELYKQVDSNNKVAIKSNGYNSKQTCFQNCDKSRMRKTRRKKDIATYNTYQHS